ncbi:MAG: hypothetical protein AAF541_12020 [Pseudomonadota bacterium]
MSLGKKCLLAFGWMSVIGSIFDAALAVLALIIAVFSSTHGFDITSDTLFKDYLPWIYWIKALAYEVLDRAFVDWIFALPAIGLFTVRAVVSTWIGNWALRVARR